jgi:hypothetical protein
MNWIRAAAACAMAVTLSGVAANLTLRLGQYRLTPLRPGEQFVMPKGRTLDGNTLDAAATRPSCVLVRYADDRCRFCKRDKNLFGMLEAATREHHGRAYARVLRAAPRRARFRRRRRRNSAGWQRSAARCAGDNQLVKKGSADQRGRRVRTRGCPGLSRATCSALRCCAHTPSDRVTHDHGSPTRRPIRPATCRW